MPSLLGTTVAANYGRMTAQTTYGTGNTYSNFGTRNLRFVKAVVSGGSANDLTKGADGSTGSYTDALSPFSKSVRALQAFGEIYFLGVPSSTAFVFAVSDDTLNDADSGNTSNAGYGFVEAAIAAAIGSGTVTVTTLTATGASIA